MEIKQAKFRCFSRPVSVLNFSLSLIESITETRSVVLIFEFVNEILFSEHSNKISSAVLLPICFSIIYKMKFVTFLEF